ELHGAIGEDRPHRLLILVSEAPEGHFIRHLAHYLIARPISRKWSVMPSPSGVVPVCSARSNQPAWLTAEALRNSRPSFPANDSVPANTNCSKAVLSSPWNSATVAGCTVGG